MANKKALIMVDLQNDFCNGGSLAVPHGDDVVLLANQLQPHFNLIVASQDWHPRDHASFASNHYPNHGVGDVIEIDGLAQVLWPDHCIQNTNGAEFHRDLDTHKIAKIFHKGVQTNIDSYSAFFDNAHQRATGLAEYLRAEGVTQVYVIGLATDYCVKYTSLDANELGFEVFVIEDACRGVDLKAGDCARAFSEMQAAGVICISSKEILKDS